VVSTLICLGWIQLKASQGKTEAFDFGILSRDIRAYGESDTLLADSLTDTQSS
jgi:hypothetical protein